MKYLTPEEIKANKGQVQGKFQIKPTTNARTIKGRCAGIFFDAVSDKKAKILDFGVGSGAFLKSIHERGYQNLYGCDIDNYTAEEVRPFIKDFKTFDASFDKFPHPDQSFDVVTAWEVFEHLENPHNAIREVHRVIKPGGLLIMSVPNIFHIVSRLVFLKRGLFPRWNETNNHISMFPHGIFEKTFLKYFDLKKEGYVFSKINLPLLSSIKWLPENQWFGNWVYYVLKKK
ncbi:MAG: class I SAM-dependent methyltransferase [Patescibacteria group bacterium]